MVAANKTRIAKIKNEEDLREQGKVRTDNPDLMQRLNLVMGKERSESFLKSQLLTSRTNKSSIIKMNKSKSMVSIRDASEVKEKINIVLGQKIPIATY